MEILLFVADLLNTYTAVVDPNLEQHGDFLLVGLLYLFRGPQWVLVAVEQVQ